MKKISETRLATILISAIDLRSWTNFDQMKAYTIYLWQGITKFFIPQKRKRGQSFAKTMEEYHLTDKQLLKQQRALHRLSLLMSLFAVSFLAYSIYLFFHGAWRAFILDLVVMMIAWTLAFRYHFWYFQIKQRKLGCSFNEWFKQGLLGEKYE